MSSSKGFRQRGWVLAIAIGIALALSCWLLFQPGPLDFVNGRRVTLSAYRTGNPTGVPAQLASAGVIDRGRYLADAAGCAACHTTADGKLFAGGNAFVSPFGTIYSPNITRDKETGIGSWTDSQFLRALHDGVRPDGGRLYPAFPYTSFTYLTDADALAIKAFIFSVPAAHNVVPRTALRFPFSERRLMAMWAFLYNPSRRFRPVADRSLQWNRGAYIAEGLAHCGECHTPRNLVEALDNRSKFAGAVTEGWRAFNITGDRVAGIGSWSDAALAQYLTTGHAAMHGTAAGPMAEAVDQGLSRLTNGDIQALITYLRTIPAIANRGLPPRRTRTASTFPKRDSTCMGLGRRVYQEACASCHGWSGRGELTPLATLTGAEAVNDRTGVNVASVVLFGVNRARLGTRAFMPSFSDAYSDAEIAALVNYVSTRFGRGSHMTSMIVASLRKSGN